MFDPCFHTWDTYRYPFVTQRPNPHTVYIGTYWYSSEIPTQALQLEVGGNVKLGPRQPVVPEPEAGFRPFLDPNPVHLSSPSGDSLSPVPR